MIKRVSSGIPGFDRLIQGGFVGNSVNLVTGTTGAGKTIFGSQFLWHGLKKGETGVMITMEESPEDVKGDALQFGWDFDKYEKKGLFRIIYHDPAQVNNLGSVIMDELSSISAKRLVIDSMSVMDIMLKDTAQIRRRIFGIVSSLKKGSGCTTLLIAEIPEDSKVLSRYGVEEFVADSVIVMNYMGIGEEYNRSLMVRKMRRTNHGKDVYPFEITNNGVTVKRAEL